MLRAESRLAPLRRIQALALAIFAACPGLALAQAKGVALVLGNSLYSGGQPVVSGQADAEAVIKTLRKLHFDIIEPSLNLNLDDANDAIDAFIDASKSAASAVFFYSGHGYQVKQHNYLMPIGGSINPDSSIDVDLLVQRMSHAAPAIPKFVFLDACRKATVLPHGIVPGLAKVDLAPKMLVEAFAAGPGQVAESGTDKLSPYTDELVVQLPVPGLSVQELLGRVKYNVSKPSSRSQTPTETDLSSIPVTFFFSDPVTIQGVVGGDGKGEGEGQKGKLEERSDDLLVVVNGRVAIDRLRDGLGPHPITLRAGENSLLLFVSDQKSFTNGQTWERTEGWKYRFNLLGPGGSLLISDDCKKDGWCFAAEEAAPFKDGPHHGRAFDVARAVIYVDPGGNGVQLQKVEQDVWNTEGPLYAHRQERLYWIALDNLGLDPNSKLGRYRKLVDFARKALEALELKDAMRFPDLSKIFAEVWGIPSFGQAVEACMTQQVAQRISDAEQSLDAALKGDKRPFATFDESLNRCVRGQHPKLEGQDIPDEQIRIWTAFHEENESKAAPAVEAAKKVGHP